MRQLFEECWKEIVGAYQNGRINSERTLQAKLFSALERRLPKSAVVLCEPTIDLQKVGTVIPDVVVVDGGEVCAVVELKFVPHHFPLYKGDLEKLQAYGRAADRFLLMVEPISGKFTTAEFRFSTQCLLVFGAVGQKCAEAMDRGEVTGRMAEFQSRFLPLLLAVG